jgi:drug/metabolite transporter (DMT)-like permease
MGILFAILAAFSQSVLWISLKKSYEQLSPSVAFFFDMVLGLLVWIPFSLLIGVNFSLIKEVLVYAIVSAVLSEAFVFYVMSKGEVSYTSTIFSTYPVFTILFSIIINHESLTSIQWLYVTLIIVGTIIVSFPKKITKQELAKKSFIIWPLLGALAVGISDTLSKSIINRSSSESFLFGLALAQIPVALAYLKYEKASIPSITDIRNKWNVYRFALLGSILNVLTVLFLWLAFGLTSASIASPITASYPGLVIILAIVFLHEKVTNKDLFGFLLISAGVIAISNLI